jgi:hypothetical protein
MPQQAQMIERRHAHVLGGGQTGTDHGCDLDQGAVGLLQLGKLRAEPVPHGGLVGRQPRGRVPEPAGARVRGPGGVAFGRAGGSARSLGVRARTISTSASLLAGNLDDRTLSLIADVPPAGPAHGTHRLLDIAVLIRSKDAGVNRLTFDILFTSAEKYVAALRSNVFYKDNMATILDLPRERLVGTFFVDACNAVKISIERPNISPRWTSATCSGPNSSQRSSG